MSDPIVKAHPECWGERGHICQEPSGRVCVEPGCGQPAGTSWGPYWCPDCDVKRLDRVSAGFRSLLQENPNA